MEDRNYDSLRSAYLMRGNEKKELRKYCNVVSAGALSVLVISVCISAVVSLIPGLAGMYAENEVFKELYGLFTSVLSMSVPSVIIIKWGRGRGFTPIGVDRTDGKTLLRYFMLCLGVLYAANLITSVIVEYAAAGGVELSQPDFSLPESPSAFFIYFIEVTLGAGIFEEFMFRGAVLGVLRRFGDKTAIVISALLFSFLHGNFVQGPFTFMFALFLGYVMCKTNNIVYPIVLHACNNGLSVLISLGSFGSEAVQTVVNVMYVVVCICFGIIGLVKTLKADKLTPPVKEETGVLTMWQKTGVMFSSPVVIIFMILCLIMAFNYVTVQ